MRKLYEAVVCEDGFSVSNQGTRVLVSTKEYDYVESWLHKRGTAFQIDCGLFMDYRRRLTMKPNLFTAMFQPQW